MKAMILAAGLGKRLFPVTRRLPKPMMRVFDTPIIELNLKQLREQGIKDIIINLHHLPMQIIKHLKDGDSLGVRITYSLEPTILGTAGGIKKMEKELGDSPFFVVNADTYRRVDYNDLLDCHRNQGAVVTMLLKGNRSLPADKAVYFDERQRITGLLDLYNDPHCQHGTPADFLGVQVMDPEVLHDIPRGVPWGLLQVYANLLRSGKPLAGYLSDGYWMDLGTLDGYRRIHMNALDGACPLDIPGQPVKPGLWMGEMVSLDPSARITPPVSLGAGCIIRKHARIGPYAVLGSGCVVEKGADISHSILWNDVTVEEDAKVSDLLVSHDFRCNFPFQSPE